MKTSTKILLGVTAITAAAVAGILISKKRSRNNNGDVMSSKVADEGYETAHDVLFPNKFKNEDNLRYGPVLPK